MKKGPLKSRPVKSLAGVSLLCADEGQEVTIEGEVIWAKSGDTLAARVRTESSFIEVRIFHPTALHRRMLVRGTGVRLIGRLTRWHGRPTLVHPRILFTKPQN